MVLVARFYVVMGMLTVECSYIPDFNASIPPEDRLPIFLGRHYTGCGSLNLDRLSDALYHCLKQSEDGGQYHTVTDWL